MGNFINDQITKFLNKHLTGIGSVDTFDLRENSVIATVNLLGETEPVQLELAGIAWSSGEGKFHIHYSSASASKPWIQGLLNLLSEKTGKKISATDKISLMPLKMMLPKHEPA
jgi:hypothetical protein